MELSDKPRITTEALQRCIRQTLRGMDPANDTEQREKGCGRGGGGLTPSRGTAAFSLCGSCPALTAGPDKMRVRKRIAQIWSAPLNEPQVSASVRAPYSELS